MRYCSIGVCSRATIGCELVEASYPRILGKQDSFIYINEEGRLKDNHYFMLEGQEYAGAAIVIGGVLMKKKQTLK